MGLVVLFNFVSYLFYMKNIQNVNLVEIRPLPSPKTILSEIVRTSSDEDFIGGSREAIHNIIFGKDKRLLVVVGPCSIHDVTGGLDYARRLAELSKKVSDRIYLVMRTYFEKPRTTTGWKGLILDPYLDGSSSISEGIRLARQFLKEVIELGVPTATEFLDPITPQYIADLTCWAAIGARTTESQTHRQLASGLSMPIGFKNSPDGSIETASNAIKAAIQPQLFMGINEEGMASSVQTRGNVNCHIILRGGKSGPNYDNEHVTAAADLLDQNGLPQAIMVDCSHDNSSKNIDKQKIVFRDVVGQVVSGSQAIFGIMLESNIEAGKQVFPQPVKELVYGLSITDACVGWEDTEQLIMEAYEQLGSRFKK